jgi:hypothetical protein
MPFVLTGFTLLVVWLSKKPRLLSVSRVGNLRFLVTSAAYHEAILIRFGIMCPTDG